MFIGLVVCDDSTAIGVILDDDVHSCLVTPVQPLPLIPPQGTYDYILGDWNVGDIPPSTSVIFNYDVTTDVGSAGTNCTMNFVYTSSTTIDPNAVNDASSIVVAIQ